MIHRWVVAGLVAVLLTATSSAQAQTPRFRWETGQVLVYRVAQVTSASEVVEGSKAETTTKLNHTKRWQVLGVEPAGVATLQLSLTALRIETTTPRGEVILFDSANLEKSNPQMREQLAGFVGKPLAVLRMDGLGKVIEVKECKYGAASRFESEPPFVLVLPGMGPALAQGWERAYQITLEPPQGTGEKFDAVQKYVCKASDGGTATVSLTTLIPKLPMALADQIPLLQMQPAGEVVFDVQAGRLQSARLHVDKELKGHQGEGSSYHFQSNYTEEFVPNP
jgi:hypothetical protein